MATVARRSLDEISRLGIEKYKTRIEPSLSPKDHGKFVVIDIDSGDFEMDEDDLTAVLRMRSRRPDAETWLQLVGEETAYKIRIFR